MIKGFYKFESKGSIDYLKEGYTILNNEPIEELKHPLCFLI